MKNLLPIGRFSKICRLTVKALRHYDELGLLQPAVVDPASGYRYYSLAQAAEAERIGLLRTLDLPLDEIARLLREREPDARRRLLDGHRARMEARLAETRQVLAYLEKLVNEEGAMPYEVTVKQVEPQSILSIRTRTSLAEIGQAAGQAFGELYAYLGQLGVPPAGPPLAIYHDPEFREDDMDAEFCVPVGRPLSGKGRMNGGSLPGGPAACTLHAGPYPEIGPAYQAVMGWIHERGHETAGPPREVYLVGPAQRPDPADFRTELVWPIRP